MSRPDSPHVTSLKSFRQRLVDARRAAALEPNLDLAQPRFLALQQTIALVDDALDDEMDLTPLPRVDAPTEPKPPL